MREGREEQRGLVVVEMVKGIGMNELGFGKWNEEGERYQRRSGS